MKEDRCEDLENSIEKKILVLLEHQNYDEAFTLMFNVYYKYILAYCLSIIEEKKDIAEDIVQEVFLIAVEKYLFSNLNNKRLFLGYSSIKTWLCGIAKNLIREFVSYNERREILLRKNSRAIYINTHDDPEDSIFTTEQFMGLEGLMSTLKDTEYRIVYLYFLSNHNIEEIAELYGLSRSTIHRKLSKAVIDLKQAISI
jgi:RNA polymerase sigma-70 factor, ECF subfamily